MRDYWEFPGGKVELSETSAEALCRELREELDIDVQRYTHLQCLHHDYDDLCVAIDFFHVSKWTGEPRAKEGQRLRWVDIRDLDRAGLLPADVPLVDVLREL